MIGSLKYDMITEVGLLKSSYLSLAKIINTATEDRQRDLVIF